MDGLHQRAGSGRRFPVIELHGNILFSIGTSSLVEPAASLPFLALKAGKCVIEINPNPTPLTSQASYTLSAPAGIVLPAMVQAVWGDVNHS